MQNKRALLTLLAATLGLVIFLLVGTLLVMTRVVFPFEYRAEIYREAEARELDAYLVAAVIREESRFRVSAETEKGAVGLSQLMPETAIWVAEEMDLTGFSLDRLYEPEINIAIGCWYLSHLVGVFDGSVPVALAAYNGGRGRVQKWMQQDIWDGSADKLNDIPTQETREFVKRVLLSYRYYRFIYEDVPRYFRMQP